METAETEQPVFDNINNSRISQEPATALKQDSSATATTTTKETETDTSRDNAVTVESTCGEEEQESTSEVAPSVAATANGAIATTTTSAAATQAANGNNSNNHNNHNDTANKKRKRSSRPRKRDTKAPKPPRTALELYQIDSRKDYIQKHGGPGVAHLPKDFAAQQSVSFERLTFHTLQKWKVAEAEDLVRYQRQLQHYNPTEGYDSFGNLIMTTATATNRTTTTTAVPNQGGDVMDQSGDMKEEDDDDEEEDNDMDHLSQPLKKMASQNTNSNTAHSIFTASVPSPHLTLTTASFTDLVYELVKFKMSKGHCRVPVKKGGILGKWIDKIRKEYKRHKPNDGGAEDHGDSEHVVAGSSTDLSGGGVYVMALHDNTRLDPERIQVLTHLGMVWEYPNEDYEEIWQNHFHQLVEFKEQHGHCNVPQKGHGKLSWWVKIQRELYVNTTTELSTLAPRSRPRQTMPQHRIRQLESIGFEWRVRPPALKWDDRYHELLEYKAIFGDCNVPQNYLPNRVLGKWVMKQRGFYYDKIRGRKSPLNKERQDRLEAAGFAWVAPHVCKTKAKLPLRENIVKQQSLKASLSTRAQEDTKEEDADDEEGKPQHAKAPQQLHRHPFSPSHDEQPQQQQQQQQQQVNLYATPLHHQHMQAVMDHTRQFLPHSGLNVSVAASTTAPTVVPNATVPTNMYHGSAFHQPTMDQGVSMQHHTNPQQQQHHPQPGQEHLHHLRQHLQQQQQQHHPIHYATAGQVAAATYPYVTNTNGEQQPQLEQQEVDPQYYYESANN